MSFNSLFNQDPTGPSSSHDFRVVLLDGGLGTTLEDLFHQDISHPLWSTKLISEKEDILETAHLRFLQVGSEVIMTPTYQASYETFRRANFSDKDAEQLMYKSVKVAVNATTSHYPPTGSSRVRPSKIALSLGPFAATLDGVAEFSGVYPPPYGPGPCRSVEPVNSTDFGRGPFTMSEESSYIDALSSFHFTRLLIYATNPDIWDAIDLLAFETVPLLLEAIAIRKAMFRLEKLFLETGASLSQQDNWRKPWYISFVFPGPEGQFLQYKPMSESGILAKDAELLSPQDLVQWVFSPADGLNVPGGIGVNCTNIKFIPNIIDGYNQGVQNLGLKNSDAPWLIACPNGGVSFDSKAKIWMQVSPEDQKELENRWAETLAVGVKSIQETRNFGGLLVGGCCKTTPEHIKLLKLKLNL